MDLLAGGRFISLGVLEGDPFIDTAKWEGIVEEAGVKFPGVDLIIYKVRDAYIGLASLSSALDPMQLAVSFMEIGVLCMGSERKVNLMTDLQVEKLVESL